VGDAGGLGLVHRDVGGADQVVEHWPWRGKSAAPIAAVRPRRHRRSVCRRAATDALGAAAHADAVLDAGQQDHELVAAPPADDVGVTNGRTQTLGGCLQHEVAELVAERVVDLLEAVEVDQHHADTGVEPVGGEQRLLGLTFELATVDETGEVVGGGPPLERATVEQERPAGECHQDRCRARAEQVRSGAVAERVRHRRRRCADTDRAPSFGRARVSTTTRRPSTVSGLFRPVRLFPGVADTSMSTVRPRTRRSSRRAARRSRASSDGQTQRRRHVLGETIRNESVVCRRRAPGSRSPMLRRRRRNGQVRTDRRRCSAPRRRSRCRRRDVTPNEPDQSGRVGVVGDVRRPQRHARSCSPPTDPPAAPSPRRAPPARCAARRLLTIETDVATSSTTLPTSAPSRISLMSEHRHGRCPNLRKY
jgi:hypothetical protein